jgi:hypothetical protein
MAMSVALETRRRQEGVRAPESCPAALRAMALWPRLDRRALSRCGCDAARIANFVSRRTRMPKKAIETLLSQS